MFTHSYAAFMALARWHLLFGSEFRGLAWRNKWAPVTTSEMATYKKSIRAWQAFDLETRIICWDDEFFYVEHLFVRDGVVCMRTLVEGLVRGPSGILRPNDVFGAAGFTDGSPEAAVEQREEIACLKKLSRSQSTPSNDPLAADLTSVQPTARSTREV